jgi:hypothetical protein
MYVNQKNKIKIRVTFDAWLHRPEERAARRVLRAIPPCLPEPDLYIEGTLCYPGVGEIVPLPLVNGC